MEKEFDEFLKEWSEEWSDGIVKDLQGKVKNYIWFEANKLAIEKKKQHKESCELAQDLYNQIPPELIVKSIKKSLPLNVTLFNKIKVVGKSLNEDVITYTYHFNNDFGYKFKYVPTLTELIKLKNNLLKGK